MTSPDTASARESVGVLIAHTARQWRRAVDRHLQPFGLTEASWLPLLHIARAAMPMRQKDLALSLSLDGSSVVRLLDDLQGAGLIERKEEEGDRRAKVLSLTARGRSTVAKVERSVRSVREEATAELSDAEVAALTDALQRIALALQPRAIEEEGAR